MIFCKLTLYDYFAISMIIILNINYLKKHNKKRYVENVIVEKNAIHCQGLVKK